MSVELVIADYVKAIDNAKEVFGRGVYTGIVFLLTKKEAKYIVQTFYNNQPYENGIRVVVDADLNAVTIEI